MAELTVGIRDLKAHLSAYLKQVQQGQTIIITSHGKPIAQIIPITEDLMERGPISVSTFSVAPATTPSTWPAR